MTALLLVALVGILGGMAVGVQAPLASLMNEAMGYLESIFIVHLGGAVLAGVPLILLGGGRLGEWNTVPWYALASGALGAAVLGSMIFMVPRIGVAAAIILILAGQLIVGTLIDHYGALGVTQHSLSPVRILGLATVVAGVWITVRA